jgi:hypothetical protein
MRVNQGQEVVIGGYVPPPNNFGSMVVGYYEGKMLMYVAVSSKRIYAPRCVVRVLVENARAVQGTCLQLQQVRHGRAVDQGRASRR